jgi:hypothetical protein
MYEWGWLERPTAALLFDCEKAYEQMVNEAISQASEYFNFECHDNIQKQHGKKNWSAVIHNSVTWRTVCELYKCAGKLSTRQHSAATNIKTFYKKASTFWEESKTTDTVCCVSEAWEEEGHCVLVWCVWSRTLRGMFPRLQDQAHLYGNKIVKK